MFTVTIAEFSDESNTINSHDPGASAATLNDWSDDPEVGEAVASFIVKHVDDDEIVNGGAPPEATNDSVEPPVIVKSRMLGATFNLGVGVGVGLGDWLAAGVAVAASVELGAGVGLDVGFEDTNAPGDALGEGGMAGVVDGVEPTLGGGKNDFPEAGPICSELQPDKNPIQRNVGNTKRDQRAKICAGVMGAPLRKKSIITLGLVSRRLADKVPI